MIAVTGIATAATATTTAAATATTATTAAATTTATAAPATTATAAPATPVTTGIATIGRPLASLDDSDVVRRYIGGDERAFDELVRRYGQRVRRFINRTVRDWERAEDLMQETFIRVYRHIRRFDCDRRFSTWIFTIAGNLAKNEIRNRSKSPIVLHQTLTKNRESDDARPIDREDPKGRPDHLFRRRHLREKIAEAVAELPDHHRDVFLLREIKGLSYQEIAGVTSSNLGTVKSRLNRARTSFARIIAPMVR